MVITSYKIFEEYINSPTNRVSKLLKNMVQMFQDTFNGKTGVFSEEELGLLQFIDVSQSLKDDSFEKNIVLNFTDEKWKYQVIFIVKLDDVKEDKIEACYMQIKIYDIENDKIIKDWQENLELREADSNEQNEEGRFFVKVKGKEGDFDFIENFIISKIDDLKEPLEREENKEEQELE